MSFSKEVRAELCTAKLTCKMCAKALLYGIVLCENRTDEHIWLTTNSKETAELFISLIKDIKVSGIEEKIQNELYSIFIYDASASKKFCSYFKVADLNSIYADNLLQNDCCKTAF